MGISRTKTATANSPLALPVSAVRQKAEGYFVHRNAHIYCITAYKSQKFRHFNLAHLCCPVMQMMSMMMMMMQASAFSASYTLLTFDKTMQCEWMVFRRHAAAPLE